MNIVLCGFMGCGKTTVGKIIAKRLDGDFIDTDSLIEKEEGKKIADIFAESGEEYFRECEHKACAKLAKGDKAIIATGGGAMTFERNAKLFADGAVIIFIDADYSTIMRRIGKDAGRPLLKGDSKALFDKRRPFYIANSHKKITVCGDVSAEQVADLIIKYYIKEDKTK